MEVFPGYLGRSHWKVWSSCALRCPKRRPCLLLIDLLVQLLDLVFLEVIFVSMFTRRS